MTNDKALDITITEDNCNSIIDQMTEANHVYTLDCMALNPRINEMTRGGYELEIYKVTVDDKDVFLLYFEDGYAGDDEEFAARAEFYNTEAEAMEALGEEYNDWLTLF